VSRIQRDATDRPGRPTVLITGASSGFGVEFTHLFASDGWNVVMVARGGAAMETVAQEVEERDGVEVTVLPKDLSRAGAAADLVASLDQRGLTVDALVNNAGFSTYGEFWHDDARAQSDMLQVNVVALTELSRLLLPGMVERGRGRVLNLGSVGSFVPAPMTAAYAATKAYVLSLSLAMAEELRGTGVTVTCLCPGPTETGFQERAEMGDSALIRGRQLPDAREVARAGYAALMSGKPYLVTGGSSKAFAFGTRFLPRTTTARIAGRSQRRVGG
jgi:short-subunit dehydrogenase